MIQTPRQLADHIAGRRVLHLNSLGKDSLACLEFLAKFATCEVVSVFFKRIACHPDDDAYFEYLKKRYPNVEFIVEPNPWELGDMSVGIFQSPVRMLTELSAWEHYGFDYGILANDIAKELSCEFICYGHSKYESVARATKFYKKGLVIGNEIFPIGLMQKKEVLEIVKGSGTKVHPCYKESKGTLDRPSYYKMRAAFKANPDYEKKMLEIYPLLVLDKYRFEVLLGKT